MAFYEHVDVIWQRIANTIMFTAKEEFVLFANVVGDFPSWMSGCLCRRKLVVKDLVKIILQEAYQYSNPVTQFLEALYVKHDFDEAQARLVECSKILDNDYFLATARDEFL